MAELASFAKEAACLDEDLDDEIAHLYEALHGHWLPAETYVQGEIGIQFDLWIRPDDLDGTLKHKVALFQRLPGVDLPALQGRPDISHLDSPELQSVGLFGDGGEAGQHRPVLVFVGQTLETRQDVSAWAVPSVVWLTEFDEPDDGGMEAADAPVPLFALSVAALLRRQLIEDWKGIATRRLLPISAHKHRDHMVERCAEILDVVADDHAPLQWRLAADMDASEIARGLHVYLADEAIGWRVRSEEGLDQRTERIEMCARSLDLRDAPG